jgi:hypothetical protein
MLNFLISSANHPLFRISCTPRTDLVSTKTASLSKLRRRDEARINKRRWRMVVLSALARLVRT